MVVIEVGHKMKKLFLINSEIDRFEMKVIYGAGKEGQLLCKKLQEEGLEIDFFADSNPQIHGTSILGIEVVSMEWLKQMRDRTAVLLSKGYQEQIYSMLMDHGIENIFLSHVENGMILDD